MSDLQRIQASYEEDVAATWRDWRSYLKAHLEVIDARRQQPTTVFDRGEQSVQRISQAEQRIALLPTNRRLLFDAVRSSNSQPASNNPAQLTDPEAAEQAKLDQLLNDAEGRGSRGEPGWGLVPLGTPQDWQWFQVNLQQLNGLPDDAAYRLTTPTNKQRWRLIAAIVGLIGLCAMLWLSWPSDATVGSDGQILANGQRVERWPVEQIRVRYADGTEQTLPISSTNQLVWPDSQEPYWRRTPIHPVSLCLPERYNQPWIEIELQGGSAPLRRYRSSNAATTADLRVEQCQPNATAPATFGQLGEVISPTPLDRMATVMLDGQPFSWQQLLISTRHDQATLPEGSIQVSVGLSTTSTLEPNHMRSSLQTLGGMLIPNSNTHHDQQSLWLTYLVPADQLGQEVQLSLRPAVGPAALWRFRLDPQAERRLRFQHDLEIQPPQAERIADRLQIRLQLHNRASTSLTLQLEDLQLSSAGLQINPESPSSSFQALQPGETREFTIQFLAPSDYPITLRVGSSLFLIDIPPTTQEVPAP